MLLFTLSSHAPDELSTCFIVCRGPLNIPERDRHVCTYVHIWRESIPHSKPHANALGNYSTRSVEQTLVHFHLYIYKYSQFKKFAAY